VLEIIRSLPSGYNRDFQETKRPLMQGCELTFLSLKVFASIFSEIQVNQEACMTSFTKELFATDKVLELVKNGIPFRDAYKQVAHDLEDVAFGDPKANILSKKHQGATGNLGLQLSIQKIQEYRQWVAK
jgi:argininosuccinate lyase